MRFAVIGCPISHSLSPEVYAPLFTKHSIDADFIRMLVVPSELPRVRELTRGLEGFAVTMPHKRNIIPYLDRLSETASACGADDTSSESWRRSSSCSSGEPAYWNGDEQCRKRDVSRMREVLRQ